MLMPDFSGFNPPPAGSGDSPALDVHYLVAQHADVLDRGLDPVARQAVATRWHQARQRLPLPPSSGSIDQAVPAGVPVMMTMPGRSVKLDEKKWMSSAQVQIISRRCCSIAADRR